VAEQSRFERMTSAEVEARRRELARIARERAFTPREWVEAAELWGMPIPEWVRPTIEKEALQ